MNACIKPKLPFVAHTTLKRTPVSEQNKKVANFVDAQQIKVDWVKDARKSLGAVKVKYGI